VRRSRDFARDIGAQRPATTSTCGRQVLSKNASSPSFSFGSGPARLTVAVTKGVASSKSRVLLASTNTVIVTPAAIYEIQETRPGRVPPQQVFGSEQQRPLIFGATAMRSADVNHATGKSTIPGPGSYQQPSSVGTQTLTRSRSSSKYTFGLAQPSAVSSVRTTGPGPAYFPAETMTKRGELLKAAYSFGNEQQRTRPLNHNPGPGTYGAKSSVGKQVNSAMRSSVAAGFGKRRHIDRSAADNRPIAGLESLSPGPRYDGQPQACSKQQLSQLRSAPSNEFPHAQRFDEPASRLVTPGPGEYVI